MKLLRGQQLYISKHIHSQRAHEDISQPPPSPPITRLHPCVNTISAGGVLLDVGALGLLCRPPTSLDLSIEKIGLGSFIFKNCPDKLPNAYFRACPVSTSECLDEHIHTFLQLATIHYARIYEILILKLRTGFMSWHIAQAWIREGDPGVTIDGDEYTVSANSDWGPYGATVALAWHQDCSREYAWADYNCPLHTRLWLCRYVGPIPSVLHVYRDPDGIYHEY